MAQKNIAKYRIFTVLGIIGFIEAMTHMFKGLTVASPTLTALISQILALFPLYLLIGWYYKRKVNIEKGIVESKISKYLFWSIFGGVTLMFILIVIWGFVNFLSSLS